TWGDAVPALFRREPVQFGLAILTAGLLYVEPGLVLSLLASLVLFVIFFHRIEYGLILTIFYAPFFLFPVDLYRFAFPMSELVILITGAAWALRKLIEWGRMRQSANSAFPAPNLYERLRRFHALDWGVVAWAALGILSLTWATYSDTAFTELRTLILEPALFYLILRTIPFDKRLMLRLIDALLLAGVIVCIVGLYLYLRGEAIITAEEGARRLASVYGSPNNVGLLLGRCIPFVLAFILLSVDRLRRTAAALTMLLMLVTLALTQSAGAIFLGVPAGIVVVLLLLFGKRVLLPLAGLAVLSIVGLLVLAQASAR